MFCVVASVVLSILGIFSASNRSLAKEALDCVFRRVTLRPCNTGFDEKMKARILGSVIMRSEGAARFLNKNFEVLAWVFFVLLIGSGVMFFRGIYLFYVTGSCNGLNSSGFCVFDPAGTNNAVSTGAECNVKPKSESELTLKNSDIRSLPVLNPGAADQLVMIGCYHCEYTRKAYPDVMALVERYQPAFAFVNYPTKEETDYFSRAAFCVNRLAPQQFWKFNDLMFTGAKEQLDDPAHMNQIFTQVGLSPAAVSACIESKETAESVQAQLNEIKKTRFYGTPTLFINDRAFVGPKPYRVYAIQLKGLLYFWK